MTTSAVWHRLDDELGLLNFYVVKNQATKPEYTVDFERYCELRNSTKAFNLSEGCTRRWIRERAGGRSWLLWPQHPLAEIGRSRLPQCPLLGR